MLTAVAGRRFGARPIVALTLFAALLGYSDPAFPASIAGGSGVLTSAHANQLEVWLGEGPLTLTSVFSKSTDGASSEAFHNLADLQGRTFAVIEVLDVGFASVIGGYNPLSWDDSLNGYVFSPTHEERTAFIFNLTTGVRLDQRLDGPHGDGQVQTFHHRSFGPTFGGGYDLYVDTVLSKGYVNPQGYGTGTSLVGTTTTTDLSFGRIDVFTITVAEPALLILVVFGFAALLLVRELRSSPKRSNFALLAVAAVFTAATITVPSTLVAGAQDQLAFVTAGTGDATFQLAVSPVLDWNTAGRCPGSNALYTP